MGRMWNMAGWPMKNCWIRAVCGMGQAACHNTQDEVLGAAVLRKVVGTPHRVWRLGCDSIPQARQPLLGRPWQELES